MKGQRWLLDIALDHLNLGRARLYSSILAGGAALAVEAARAEIETAVDGLRDSGSAHHIPRGLLTRAWLRFVTGDEDGARADLDEAQEIAERGSMRLSRRMWLSTGLAFLAIAMLWLPRGAWSTNVVMVAAGRSWRSSKKRSGSPS